MSGTIQQQFQAVVNQVFNNWSALQLAIDHGMGGPLSRQVANQLADYLVEVCCSDKNVCEEMIEDILLDSLETEFNTECEDNSPREVSMILYRFVRLLKDGKFNEYEIEYQKLPTRVNNAPTSSQNQSAQASTSQDNGMEVEESSSEDEQPEEDGWTTIKGRRKK